VLSVLSRYLTKEVLGHFLGVFAIILGIFVVRRFAGLLADAAEGSVPANVVFHLLGLRTLVALPSLLPAVLYISILLALGRLYQDHEMTALSACGVAPARVWEIVVGLSAVIALGIGALSLSVRPWAAGKFDTVESEAVRTLNVGGLSPGRFYEVGRGEQVFFAGRRSQDGEMKDVFYHDRRGETVSILVSGDAIEQIDEETGYRFLTLRDGYRYDLRPDQGDLETTRYRQLVIRTAMPAVTEPAADERSASTLRLVTSGGARDIAELQWRLSMPASTLVLALLALPLSRVSPRRGKYAKLFVAILIYLAYRQLLGVSKEWVENESLPPLPGVWGVHALCLIGAVILLLRNSAPWIPWWRRSREKTLAVQASGEA
jgi:lipopolysaccharide export system permease protein